MKKKGSEARINIINADIILKRNSTKLGDILLEDSKRAFIAHRMPVKSYLDANASCTYFHKSYRKGIDFFSGSYHDLEQCISWLSPSLSLGMPWWDIALALSLAFTTKELSTLPADNFRHIEHISRQYDVKSWSSIGIEACHSISKLAKEYPSPLATRWLKKYAQAMIDKPNKIELLKALLSSYKTQNLSFEAALELNKLVELARHSEKVIRQSTKQAILKRG